jgi:CHAP domain
VQTERQGLGSSVTGVHSANVARRRQPRKSLRWFALVLGTGAVVVILVATLYGFGGTDSFAAPSEASLARLSLPQRIVALAESQVGYSSDPPNSYCNKFSAYWDAGTAHCPSGESGEEWCADFAAWAWQMAGVQITYGYGPGEINGAAVSFYEWGVATGNWHAATSGYVAEPGDVAVYGLSLGTDPFAAHVAIVTGDAQGQRGPDVVNGDGDQTGFSVVEAGTDQAFVHGRNGDSKLAGYVSPF